MSWRILCDFDGTIATRDVTDSLLEEFALPGWEEIESAWKNGRIGSRDCMSGQVDLIRATRRQLDDHLDSVEIDPGFPAFAATCADAGVPLTVVSDGLDYAIRRILVRHGLGGLPILANRLEMAGPDRYRLAFPHANPDCAKSSGTCKCAIAASGATGGARGGVLNLLIGDGASDMCAAGAVDLVFAKDKLLTYCRDRHLPFVAFRDFVHASDLLATLLEEPRRLGVAAAFG